MAGTFPRGEFPCTSTHVLVLLPLLGSSAGVDCSLLWVQANWAEPSELPLITAGCATLDLFTLVNIGEGVSASPNGRCLLELTARPTAVVGLLVPLRNGVRPTEGDAAPLFVASGVLFSILRNGGPRFTLVSMDSAGTSCCSHPRGTYQPSIWRENDLGGRFSLLPSMPSWGPSSTGFTSCWALSVGTSRCPPSLAPTE